MKLVVERDLVEALVADFPWIARASSPSRVSPDRVEVALRKRSAVELARLHDLTDDGRPDRGRSRPDRRSPASAAGGRRFAPTIRSSGEPALALHLVEGAARGWLIRMAPDGRAPALPVTRLDYYPAGEEELAASPSSRSHHAAASRSRR